MNSMTSRGELFISTASHSPLNESSALTKWLFRNISTASHVVSHANSGAMKTSDQRPIIVAASATRAHDATVWTTVQATLAEEIWTMLPNPIARQLPTDRASMSENSANGRNFLKSFISTFYLLRRVCRARRDTCSLFFLRLGIQRP